VATLLGLADHGVAAPGEEEDLAAEPLYARDELDPGVPLLVECPPG
jgi:hypothetical protein